MADGALLAFRGVGDSESLGHAFAALRDQDPVGAGMGVLFFPNEHLVVALSATMAAGGGAALPAGETIGGGNRQSQDDEGEQDTHTAF
jgi:hypothetical protein